MLLAYLRYFFDALTLHVTYGSSTSNVRVKPNSKFCWKFSKEFKDYYLLLPQSTQQSSPLSETLI
jgi:hypothetical protein